MEIIEFVEQRLAEDEANVEWPHRRRHMRPVIAALKAAEPGPVADTLEWVLKLQADPWIAHPDFDRAWLEAKPV